MSVTYLHLAEGQPPPPLQLGPFKCVVIAEKSVDAEWRAKVSAWLVDSGCLYVMAWGNGYRAWHDDVDLANISDFPGRDIPEDRLVMTTSHGREPLTKIMWFAADVARHPSVELHHMLILHVAPKDRENKVLRALAKVLDRSREKKAS